MREDRKEKLLGKDVADKRGLAERVGERGGGERAEKEEGIYVDQILLRNAVGRKFFSCDCFFLPHLKFL